VEESQETSVPNINDEDTSSSEDDAEFSDARQTAELFSSSSRSTSPVSVPSTTALRN